MEKLISKIFVTIVLVILFTPAVFTVLGIKVQPADKTEKKISLNFKRNFPLKADLFKIYGNIKTNIFEADPLPQRVIDMNNGWKFLGNDFSNALSESKALLVFSKKELKVLKEKLTKKQEWFNKQNIKFYIAVPRNKHSVYGEMIPIKKIDRNTKMQQLDSLCKTIGVNFIDLGKKLPKDSKTPLYYKTDTHWNHYGSFYAFLETMEAFKKDFKNANFIDFTLDDMATKVVNTKVGDLNNMLMLDDIEEALFLNIKAPKTFVKLDNELSIPKGYAMNRANYEKRFKNDSINNNLKLLIFNDSFMEFYSEYLIRNFNNTVLIWNSTIDKELIEKEKPDIVYFEILERNIDLLMD